MVLVPSDSGQDSCQTLRFRAQSELGGGGGGGRRGNGGGEEQHGNEKACQASDLERLKLFPDGPMDGVEIMTTPDRYVPMVDLTSPPRAGRMDDSDAAKLVSVAAAKPAFEPATWPEVQAGLREESVKRRLAQKTRQTRVADRLHR